MIGLLVSKPTVGMQRQSSGKLPVSAPPENASLPAPVSTAAFCAGERSKSQKACCSNSAVSAQIALRRASRLIVISVVPSALFSTRTFCMVIASPSAPKGGSAQRLLLRGPLHLRVEHLQHFWRRHRQAVEAFAERVMNGVGDRS